MFHLKGVRMRHWLFIALCVFIAYKHWPTLHHTYTKAASFSSENQVQNDPIQKEVSGLPSFQKNGYLIKPLASFQVYGRVLSSQYYAPKTDREADIASVDLALGWGPMSDQKVIDKIQISQGQRFYHWYVTEFPIPREEIETHSGNMHLIAANDAVKAQLEDIHIGQIVHISGYLVDVHGEGGYQWHSSKTRSDTGYGACEVIWVESVAISEN